MKKNIKRCKPSYSGKRKWKKRKKPPKPKRKPSPMKMNCYACDEELRWMSDIDSPSDLYEVDTFLSCPRCEAHVVVSWGTHPDDVISPRPNNVIPIRKNRD